MKYLTTCILLISSTAWGQWYEAHPLFWDKTETVASIGEAVGVGAVLPTSSYLIWNRLSPTHRPQKRLKRIAVCHLMTAGLAVATMRGPSLHDTDERWVNPVMLMPVSMVINAIVDGFRIGWNTSK
jgi:hypothetical protein